MNKLGNWSIVLTVFCVLVFCLLCMYVKWWIQREPIATAVWSELWQAP